MFYYYGRKKRMAPSYPKPTHPTIIEPFAGAAAYSLHDDNWKREVILVERDDKVASIWKWLITEATDADMAELPELEIGDSTTEFLHIVHCVSKGAFGYKRITVTEVMRNNWNRSRKIMREALPKVKHWRITQGDYTDAPDMDATWFIDPPYQGAPGTGYRFGSDLIDYSALAVWAMERRGQVIACEGQGAKYLPFVPLKTNNGVGGKLNTEMVWIKEEA